jgi:hypothetical protein
MPGGYELVCGDCLVEFGHEGSEEITLGALFPNGIEYCELCGCPMERTSDWHWMSMRDIKIARKSRFGDA